jgi:hypothetical protein
MKNKQFLLKALGCLTLVMQANLFAEQASSTVSDQNSSMRTHHTPREDGATVQIEADGTKIITTKNKTIIQVKPDGTKIISKADGTIVQKNRDGTKIIKKADGTTVQVNPDGSKEIKKADGSTIEVKPAK